MLRVIAGKYKRRNLLQPSEEITRPTKDMVKEALFSILGGISNKSFLDAFGGSGAIGIEAYSRGANKVTIVEKNNEALKIIKKNLQNLNIFEIEVVNSDFFNFYKVKNMTYDYIFIDPPYKVDITTDFINDLYKFNIAKNESIIIVERDNILELDDNFKYNIKEYKYGKTYLFIIKKETI